MPEFNEKAMKQFNQHLIEEFRANGGKAVSGPFVNAPLLLLTTTGAKSGRPFTTPLVYTKDGNRIEWIDLGVVACLRSHQRAVYVSGLSEMQEPIGTGEGQR